MRDTAPRTERIGRLERALHMAQKEVKALEYANEQLIKQNAELRRGPQLVKEFLEEVVGVYRSYGMSLSHEDGHSGFLVKDYCEFNVQWLLNASDERGRDK